MPILRTHFPIEGYATAAFLAAIVSCFFGPAGLLAFPAILIVGALALIRYVGPLPTIGPTACLIGIEAASVGLVSNVAIGLLLILFV